MEATCFVKCFSYFLLIYGRQDSIVQCVVAYFYVKERRGGREVGCLLFGYLLV
jgi:hypothetical protein